MCIHVFVFLHLHVSICVSVIIFVFFYRWAEDIESASSSLNIILNISYQIIDQICSCPVGFSFKTLICISDSIWLLLYIFDINCFVFQIKALQLQELLLRLFSLWGMHLCKSTPLCKSNSASIVVYKLHCVSYSANVHTLYFARALCKVTVHQLQSIPLRKVTGHSLCKSYSTSVTEHSTV